MLDTRSWVQNKKKSLGSIEICYLHVLCVASRSPKSRISFGSLSAYKAKTRRGGTVKVVSALPETAASVAVAATVVGAAATFLMRRTKSSEVTEVCFPTWKSYASISNRKTEDVKYINL